MIRSDPHNPQRSTDVEIISQVWQYTALSTGIEIRAGSDRIIVTFRIDAPNSENRKILWIRRQNVPLPPQAQLPVP